MHIALWVHDQDGRRHHRRRKLPAGLLDSVIHQTPLDPLPQHLHLLEFLFLVLVGAVSLVSVKKFATQFNFQNQVKVNGNENMR